MAEITLTVAPKLYEVIKKEAKERQLSINLLCVMWIAIGAKLAPAELELGHRLQSLFKACEKNCVSGCCGISAFNFSPLHIASQISAFKGIVRETDIQELENEIDNLLVEASELIPDEQGCICTIKGTNQGFTKAELEALAQMLKQNIRLAPKVLDYANELQKNNSRTVQR